MSNRTLLALTWLAVLALVVALLGASQAAGVAAQGDDTPTPMATDTPAATGTPTATDTPTPTLTLTATATDTPTVTPMATASTTATFTPTATATATATLAHTATPSATPTPFILYAPYMVRVHPDAPTVYFLNVALTLQGQLELVWRGERPAHTTYVYQALGGDQSDMRVIATLPGDVFEYTLPAPDGASVYQVVRIGTYGMSTSPQAGILYIAPTPTATPMPTLLPNTGEIHGQLWMMRDASGARNARVELHKFDGQTTVVVAEALTYAGDPPWDRGKYVFRNVPVPGPNQYYQVVYPNAERSPSLLGAWFGARIRAFAPGQQVHGGSPIIAGATLQAPNDNASMAAPVTFSWSYPDWIHPRPRYRLLLYDVADPSRSWLTADLGAATSYKLSRLPSGMQRGRPYAWTVVIDYQELTGSYGVAFETRRITFR